MQEILLVRFGEVHLKGQNRPQFLHTLTEQVRRAVYPFHGKARLEDSRIYVTDVTDMEAAAQRAAHVFGIHSVSPAIEMEKDDPAAVFAQAARMMEGKSGTFKVKARRSDKNYPMTSPEMCEECGGVILDSNPNLTVDVKNPDHVIEIEIREKATLHTRKIMGVGGMPMGTQGKACLLLSGGIDSPVAGYMTARRGVRLICVYFHAFPYTSDRAKDKVVELARLLSVDCGEMELFVAPFTDLQMLMKEKCPDSFGTILMRRGMMRVAQEIAVREGAQAMVTGESLGQVASQTMEAIVCTDDVCKMPVFRPLIGFDKSDIIDWAEKIGTFETSSLPYEDCCTVFTPRHPATHPKLDRVREAEAMMGDEFEALIQKSVAEAERYRLAFGRIREKPEDKLPEATV